MLESFRLYDEHVNLKMRVGLKKMSGLMVSRFEQFIDLKIKQMVRDEVATKLRGYERLAQ